MKRVKLDLSSTEACVLAYALSIAGAIQQTSGHQNITTILSDIAEKLTSAMKGK